MCPPAHNSTAHRTTPHDSTQHRRKSSFRCFRNIDESLSFVTLFACFPPRAWFEFSRARKPGKSFIFGLRKSQTKVFLCTTFSGVRMISIPQTIHGADQILFHIFFSPTIRIIFTRFYHPFLRIDAQTFLVKETLQLFFPLFIHKVVSKRVRKVLPSSNLSSTYFHRRILALRAVSQLR